MSKQSMCVRTLLILLLSQGSGVSARQSEHHSKGRTIILTGDLDGDVLGPYSAVIEEIA